MAKKHCGWLAPIFSRGAFSARCRSRSVAALPVTTTTTNATTTTTSTPSSTPTSEGKQRCKQHPLEGLVSGFSMVFFFGGSMVSEARARVEKCRKAKQFFFFNSKF